jgi:hypothetical protein
MASNGKAAAGGNCQRAGVERDEGGAGVVMGALDFLKANLFAFVNSTPISKLTQRSLL